MTNPLPFFLLLLALAACHPGDKPEMADTTTPSVDSVHTLASDTLIPLSETGGEEDAEETTQEYETFHILTIGEGNNYDSLNAEASKVAQKLQVKVNNLERIYDPAKGIVVSPDAEDEMYRGEYYPRRFADPSVSVEMRYAFADSPGEEDRTMVIVAGIYEQKSQADSVLALTQATYPAAKVITKELFIGCMH